jgi:hypothetical protein
MMGKLSRDWRRNRTVHPVFARGGFAIIVAWPLRLIIGPSEWNRPIGQWIARGREDSHSPAG